MTIRETPTAILIDGYTTSQQFSLLSLGCWWSKEDTKNLPTLRMRKPNGGPDANVLAVLRYLKTQ